MERLFLVSLLLSLSLLGCAESLHQFSNGQDKERKVCIISVLDRYEDEYSENNWFLAIHNLKTGYACYYDRYRNFLGRRKIARSIGKRIKDE